MLWWGAYVNKGLKPYYIAMPSVIIWELWRRRNNSKHDGKRSSIQRVIHNVIHKMHKLLKVRKPK